MGGPEDEPRHEHRTGLPPVLGGSPKVLILGTAPSVLSAQKGEYYGNPRNHFWPLMAEVLGREMPDDYSGRCGVLVSNGVALWDMLARCDIRGSDDGSITNPVPNDLQRFADVGLRQVFINGRTAFRLYERFNGALFKGIVTSLPSSSPANAMTLSDKLERWMEIRRCLQP